MTRNLRVLLVPLWLVGALLAVPALAGAEDLSLEQAKQQGLVGEQSDGYLGLVPADPPEAARALVKRINTRRTEIYADIAKREGISVVAVAARSGERLIREATPGEWIWQDGGWHRKGS